MAVVPYIRKWNMYIWQPHSTPRKQKKSTNNILFVDFLKYLICDWLE